MARETSVKMLPIDRIRRSPFQPRIDFDERELGQLAESIKRNNIIQPIIVRPVKDQPGNYELVAGERRWRAAQLAQVHDIEAIVRPYSDEQAQEIGILENKHRQDLSPIEEARAYRRLLEQRALTHDELADILSISRTSITHLLRLLELAVDVQTLIHKGQLSAGHGKALAGLSETSQQRVLANRAVREGMSVRRLEEIASELEQKNKRAQDPAKYRKDPDQRRLEQVLADHFGTVIAFNVDKKAKGGEMKIHYHDIEHLQGILARMNIPTEFLDQNTVDPPPKKRTKRPGRA